MYTFPYFIFLYVYNHIFLPQLPYFCLNPQFSDQHEKTTEQVKTIVILPSYCHDMFYCSTSLALPYIVCVRERGTITTTWKYYYSAVHSSSGTHHPATMWSGGSNSVAL